ncbi:hypothetical protein DFR39_109190 [Roseateles asaccharophilus]|uniref:Uncharacterized protein n=2 Tax=Roseateles asaccharophilus TaxID=582607 RepID=A0A4R6MVN6_9BURK|nr:hypothetical protein DFR39_109190 [Roseateles asaccharophilus]
MHVQDPEMLPNLRLSCFSAVGDGMHVEVSRPDGMPSPDPLMTFREDEELGMQVVLHGSDHDVVLSLAELKRAIAFAASEVHRESFYE